MNAVKTPEEYGKIIDRKNATIKKQEQRIKELEEDQLKRGRVSVIRASAYKEGYDTCYAQNVQEIEGLKAKIAFIDNNVARFLNLEMPVSKFYEVLRRGERVE